METLSDPTIQNSPRVLIENVSLAHGTSQELVRRLASNQQSELGLSSSPKDQQSHFILKNVSLEIAAGCCTAILGLSGCGKSTLLKTIIGLVQPHIGQVRIGDTVMCPTTMIQLRQKIGYCVQDGGLFPHLTVFENIVLMARIMKWPIEKIKNRVEELLHLTQLKSDLIHRYPSQLSGGQKQRVSLMRSLFLDPGLLLLDEPMGALDPMVRSELQEELKEIFRRLRKTVVLVTHDLSEAVFLSESLVLMKEGEVVQRGSMNEFLQKPSDPFVSKFIYSQRTHLLEANV